MRRSNSRTSQRVAPIGRLRRLDWIRRRALPLLASLALSQAVDAATEPGFEPDGEPIVLLLADFNDKPVGQPIGTGGAAMGEPVSIDPGVSAVVEQPVGANRVLALEADALQSAGGVSFELLGGAGMEEGVAVLRVTLAFPAPCTFRIAVREPDFNAQDFTTIDLTNNGTINVSDEAGSAGQVGIYAAGQILRFAIEHDLDAGTYDVLLNDVVLVDDRPHGVAGSGIGRFLMGFDFAQPPTRVLLDNVEVQASVPPNRIFGDGFEITNPF